jgi:hypothetical protein
LPELERKIDRPKLGAESKFAPFKRASASAKGASASAIVVAPVAQISNADGSSESEVPPRPRPEFRLWASLAERQVAAQALLFKIQQALLSRPTKEVVRSTTLVVENHQGAAEHAL